jgi:hypothetical protein
MREKEMGPVIDHPTGSGPLADSEPDVGRPIDDPTLADRSNPRWDDPAAPHVDDDAQPSTNPDGSPNVMPTEDPDIGVPVGDTGSGTDEDQAARTVGTDQPGRDNIREGRGGGTANPALAEGGDNG